MINPIIEKVKTVNKNNWTEVCLDVFHYQYESNPIYRQYCDLLSVKVDNVKTVLDIPFLPIEFFKSHTIKSGIWSTAKVFKSSGTVGSVRSNHHIKSSDQYLTNAVNLFETIYGKLNNYIILALLPSYQEQGDSSLVAMVDYFIAQSGNKHSAYVMNLNGVVSEKYILSKKLGLKLMVIGVTYSLLDFAENGKLDLAGSIIMETGGMKGRREEIVREDLHARLKSAFNVEEIHSEYGMTELQSQAYSTNNGEFLQSDMLRILIRELNDPFSWINSNKIGGINVVDLANIDSVSFIETKDLGRLNANGTFSVMGRYDNSDIRGCNLLLN